MKDNQSGYTNEILASPMFAYRERSMSVAFIY